MASDEKKLHTTSSLNQKLGIEEEDSDTQMLGHPSYEELQKQLTEEERKSNDYYERLLRFQAEMENNKQRMQREAEKDRKFALEKFVTELLPVVDNLERAIAAHLSEESGEGSLLEGVRLTLKMLQAGLEKMGVEEVDPIGQAFKPEWHQAVSITEDPGQGPGIVLNVLQKGYLLNKRLMRPALVIVSK